VIRVDQSPNGPIAETELLPLMVLIDGAGKAEGKAEKKEGGARKLEIPEKGSFSRNIKLLNVSSGGANLPLAALPLPVRFAA
jgi:hypothetical protein